MKGLSKILRSVLLACMPLAVLCVVLSTDARAATITSAATGNWAAGGTWVGGVAPVATDNAVIAAGHTVTLTANRTITGLTVNATGVAATSTFTLGVSGSLVVNGTLSGTGAITLSGAGTNIDGTGSITNTAQLTISAAHTILSTANLSFSGTIRVQGAITVTNNGTVTTATAGGITGTAGGSTWTQGTTGVLNIAGPLLTTGTLTASANGNTVNYNGAAQTVKATATYHHLTLGGSGIKTLTATTTAINGNLTMSGTATTATVVGLTIGGDLNVGTGTTFTAAAFALTVSGTTSVTGTLTISSATGAKAFNGDVTVNGGGTWNNTAANAALTLPGSISNSGTFNAGTGVHTFSGAGKDNQRHILNSECNGQWNLSEQRNPDRYYGARRSGHIDQRRYRHAQYQFYRCSRSHESYCDCCRQHGQLWFCRHPNNQGYDLSPSHSLQYQRENCGWRSSR